MRIFIILLLISNSAFAANAYFEATKISPNSITKPFEIGDEKWQKEVAIIIKMQSNYDEKRITKAALQKELRVETLIFEVDKNLQREKYPKLYLLLDRVGETSYKIGRHLKNHYAITRPYLASDEIKNLIEPSKGYSYPSGHASGSYIYAFVLGMVFENDKEEYLKIAEEIAQNRILVGMHYPQDISGGKELAKVAIDELLQNKEFLQDLEAAKKETKQNKN